MHNKTATFIAVLLPFFSLTGSAGESPVFVYQDEVAHIKLENFDDLFVGNPVDIEKNLQALLPQAEALTDKSIYLQILSQIALTQALQKNFQAAHETLDAAEGLLVPEYTLARVRILCERGRVFMQSGNNLAARTCFEQSFELSSRHQFDAHTINAAHMIPFVIVPVEEKIKWNERAIEMAEGSQLAKARLWKGSLYNNLGQAYLESKQYEKALPVFKKAQAFREEEGYIPNIRVAKWAVARTLRFLNSTEEALDILLALNEEYDVLIKSGKLDMPEEMLLYAHGLLQEEIAEIYSTKAKTFSGRAYEALSQNEWIKKLDPKKLERLKQLKESD